MRVVADKEATIELSTVIKHPENYTIIGMIKFNSLNYLYKLTRLQNREFIWVNLTKAGCLNSENDSNAAAVYFTTEDAVSVFMVGGTQHELHVFNRTKDYIDFLSKYL